MKHTMVRSLLWLLLRCKLQQSHAKLKTIKITLKETFVYTNQALFYVHLSTSNISPANSNAWIDLSICTWHLHIC